MLRHETVGVVAEPEEAAVGIRPATAGGKCLRGSRRKRALDVAAAAALGLTALPVVVAAAVAIRWKTGGPAFYRQWREGLDGNWFGLWKLRTMHTDAEMRLDRYLMLSPEARAEWERRFKLRDDPRVIGGVGWLLRRTSIDELPQLWNVLRGEMSMVGPRPLPEYHLARFPAHFREMRRNVRPGLTGLWQVSARSDGAVETQQRLDLAYIEGWSLWMDVRVLARTPMAVVRGDGAK